MNSRRKILAVLLLVVMAVSLLSVCALAADDGDDAAKSITCTTCNGTGVSQGEECGACEGTGVITSTSRMAFSFWALVQGLGHTRRGHHPRAHHEGSLLVAVRRYPARRTVLLQLQPDHRP